MYILISIIALVFLHPFHVSVTDIVYKEDQESLEITHRFFVDDMEETIDKSYSVSIDIYKEQGSAKLDSILNIYIRNHFKMFVEKEMVQYKYLGHEVDADAIWLFL